MNYKIFYTSKAFDDLSDIYAYIAFQFLEPQTAKKLYNDITEAIQALEVFPLRNALYENEPYKSRGLRKLHIKNYIVFYTVSEEKKTVNILRMIYGARDFDKHLSEIENL